jgi:hypothetical protein
VFSRWMLRQFFPFDFHRILKTLNVFSDKFLVIFHVSLQHCFQWTQFSFKCIAIHRQTHRWFQGCHRGLPGPIRQQSNFTKIISNAQSYQFLRCFVGWFLCCTQQFSLCSKKM